MGKKHKKHKSEKHTHDGRPLKLVLKVAGNEVTTGSPSLESVYDDSVDYDKDKKKKKKKKDEKDRMTKKRKVPDSVHPDWDEQSRTPARSDVSQDKPLTPSLARMEEKEQTPLQEALSQLIRQLQRKDPSAFFSFPVTDLIAPGYSLIIKRPMDFSTMKEKVKKEQFQSLEELKLDFKVMCENAMIYNKPETIYYKAAKKLLHSGMKILKLHECLHCLCSRDSKDDAKSQAEKDLEEIKKIVEDSGGKLSNRSLQCEQLEFERRKSDGLTTLGILNPADLSAGDPGYCPVKLGMMGGRLQTGINTLQGFKEDKRNMVTPVSYMNYCPFSSYAPTYDSSFANISKEDSDLIYSFYGEDNSQPESESIADYLAKSEEHMSRLADNVLDALTSGEHSRQLKETETVRNLTTYLFILKFPLPPLEAEHFQQKLDETTVLLRELQKVQKERLSAKQPPNIICLLSPTAKELQLAEKVTGNLAQLTSQVTPGDVCSLYGIRKAMGISLPNHTAQDSFIHLTTGNSKHKKYLGHWAWSFMSFVYEVTVMT
uniref:Bromodomain containing 7 n=1 Tax=Cyprinus carpio TaxID=7962 RepID=A0A8C1VPP0_CYPCA